MQASLLNPRSLPTLPDTVLLLLPRPHRRPFGQQIGHTAARRHHAVHAESRESYVLVDPVPQGTHDEAPAGGRAALLGLSAQAWLFVGLALSLATWGINRIRQQSSLATDGGHQADMRRQQQRQDESISPNPTDGREYKMALARTRQAVAVHKAMQFNAQGSPARAMVELRRALQENSTVREPLLNARYEKQEVMELYRMHLQNSEVPAKFSTLLQLRELLDIDGPEAEAMEVEVMQSGGYFSI